MSSLPSTLLAELRNEIDAGRTVAAALEPIIRKEIINGTFAPGTKLALKDLAERYEAGIIPLREALSRLCASGFVDAVDQKGFRVAEASLGHHRDAAGDRASGAEGRDAPARSRMGRSSTGRAPSLKPD